MFTIIGGDGQEYGPANTGQVRAWIAAGRASLDTKAKALGSDEWRRLGDYAEFASPGTPPPLIAVETVATIATPLPSRWVRLAAAFIDGILKSLCWLPASVATWHLLAEQIQSGQEPSFTTMMHFVQASIFRAVPLLLVLAVVQCALLATRGQSVGKLVCGLRVVRFGDAASAGFVHAVLLRGFIPTVIEQIPILGGLFWIVDACFIFGDEKRCVHDFIADTKVVKA